MKEYHIARHIDKQGMMVTIPELKDLIKELETEDKRLLKIIGKPYTLGKNPTKFQIDIINKTPKCSDTWEIEKASWVK